MTDEIKVLGTGVTAGIGSTWDDGPAATGIGDFGLLGPATLYDPGPPLSIDVAGIAQSLQAKGRK